MYDSTRKCGVLTDFDLSILQWEPGIIGTDHTGTIPFMAIDILTQEYWRGETRWYHCHELESFFWILVSVFMLYKDGQRHPNEYIDSWITSDYNKCREKKADFLSSQIALEKAKNGIQSDFEPFWDLVRSLWISLLPAGSARFERNARDMIQSNVQQAHVIDSRESWKIY